MPAENAGSLLHVQVGIGNCPQCLNESAVGFGIRTCESSNPVWRRGLHMVGAVANQQIANRQIGKPHNTIAHTRKVEGNRRLMQSFGDKRR